MFRRAWNEDVAGLGSESNLAECRNEKTMEGQLTRIVTAVTMSQQFRSEVLGVSCDSEPVIELLRHDGQIRECERFCA